MRTESDEGAATYDRDELASDLRELVQAIESLHPDPFVGYDSRIDLHARVERLVRDLPERMSEEAFYRQTASVVSGLDDAHSLVYPPDDGNADGEDRQLPLSLRVVGDTLYVESVADDALADLLGARLLTIEGRSLSELVDRSRMLRGAENRYGALLFTASNIEESSSLARLLDKEPPLETLQFEFDVGGHSRAVEIAPTAGDLDTVTRLERTFSHPEGSGPRYRLYEGGDTAVFVPGNLSDYRESLEGKLAADADVAAEHASQAYVRHVGGDEPDSVEETVAALPSMTGTLEAMGEAMTAADSETLIVDLRDNPGGDSQFAFHLAYLLDGWDGVARAADGVKAVTRRTKPHQQRYGNTGDDSATDNPAEYDFSGFFASAGEGDGPPSMVRQLLSRSQTATTFFEQHDDGLYAPEQLVVVVSAGTMSSAFACAAQLSALGADIVGVPSGQGPISFGEHVEQTLPNTGLEVRLAGSMYHWLDDPAGDILVPDRELTPERFEAYSHAGDAGLRLAFEHAGRGDSPPAPVESDENGT